VSHPNVTSIRGHTQGEKMLGGFVAVVGDGSGSPEAAASGLGTGWA